MQKRKKPLGYDNVLTSKTIDSVKTYPGIVTSPSKEVKKSYPVVREFCVAISLPYVALLAKYSMKLMTGEEF